MSTIALRRSLAKLATIVFVTCLLHVAPTCETSLLLGVTTVDAMSPFKAYGERENSGENFPTFPMYLPLDGASCGIGDPLFIKYQWITN